MFKKNDAVRAEIEKVIPVRNDALNAEKRNDGEISVTVERKKLWWVTLLAFIFYIPKKRTIQLDRIGAEVYEMCNGKNSVDAIVECFREKHKITRRESELSIVAYLRRLGKKGLLGFVVNK